MMHRLLGCLLLFFIVIPGAEGRSPLDSLIKELNRYIEKAPVYDSIKRHQIDSVRSLLLNAHTPAQCYPVYQQLYEAYKVFIFDSAFTYAKKLEHTAIALHDPVRTTEARISIGFTLLSSGMFAETAAHLLTFHVDGMPDSTRIRYYLMKGRFYFDMGDYNQDSYYTPEYNRLGSSCMDSALQLMPPSSFEYAYQKGHLYYKMNHIREALAAFPNLNQPGLNHRQIAVAACTLGNIYLANHQSDTAIQLILRSAIADIQSSTKETMASYMLATLFFEKGELQLASKYIEKSVGEAVFYGARQRKVLVSAILPIIEKERINAVEGQKKLLFIYAAIVTLLLLALVLLVITVIRQVRQLKAAQRALTLAHQRQQEINYQLVEANKIKEEYIGYCFNIIANYIGKIEKLKNGISNKLTENKVNELKYLINNINIKQEREELFHSFDRVFLKIFPHFVTEFNRLFDKPNQVVLRENELLNTDLRIFALIRIGITDNEKIAQILEYSVNTIYTYKTKIKKRSVVPNDEFEQRVMEIRTI